MLRLVAAKLGLVASKLGLVAAKLGLVAAKVGRVAAKVGRVAAKLGRVAANLGLVAAKLGPMAAELGLVAGKLKLAIKAGHDALLFDRRDQLHLSLRRLLCQGALYVGSLDRLCGRNFRAPSCVPGQAHKFACISLTQLSP